MVTDRLEDFTRINQPRVAKIGAMLAVIDKSARSLKIEPGGVADLLAPIAARFAEEAGPRPLARPTPLIAAPHQYQIGRFVDSLPAEHLACYITHLVARLCEAAEINAKESK